LYKKNGVFIVTDYLNIFKALSDENRLRILLMLRQRSLCVCEIHEVLNIALSTISAHLKIMKNTGLIEDTKDGRWVIYSLSDKTYLQELLANLERELNTDRTIESDRAIISRITREVCASNIKESVKSKS
jgi:ArsR family transcriptional regulator